MPAKRELFDRPELATGGLGAGQLDQLVRGAIFGDLDTRSLRNSIVGAGKEPVVDSRLDPVPQSIASPALLFDELELKRADASKEKLPDYPPPALGAVE